MPGNNGQFTKTEAAIMAVLADGQAHSKKELASVACGPCSISNINCHISNIRKKLPAGEDILAVATRFGRSPRFQHVRKLASAYNGRK